jgi:hypothetical protein
MFQAKVVQQIKTHILCSMTFYWKSCHLCDYVNKCGTARQVTDDNTIRRMRFACWIPKATDTHSGYVILIAFTLQHCLTNGKPFSRVCFLNSLPLKMWHKLSRNVGKELPLHNSPEERRYLLLRSVILKSHSTCVVYFKDCDSVK